MLDELGDRLVLTAQSIVQCFHESHVELLFSVLVQDVIHLLEGLLWADLGQSSIPFLGGCEPSTPESGPATIRWCECLDLLNNGLPRVYSINNGEESNQFGFVAR